MALSTPCLRINSAGRGRVRAATVTLKEFGEESRFLVDSCGGAAIMRFLVDDNCGIGGNRWVQQQKENRKCRESDFATW